MALVFEIPDLCSIIHNLYVHYTLLKSLICSKCVNADI